MITTVIFDLDDTLYDEIDYCKSGFRVVAELVSKMPQGQPADSIFDALWKEFSSGNHTETFNTALEHLGIAYDDKLIKDLVKTYRSHKPQITLPQDSAEVLRELKNRYALALLTDGFMPAQRLKVEALGIEEYFKCIIYTEELGRDYWKPSPFGFEKLLETLKTTAQNSVYIADNEKKDFIAPNKLGFFTVQLLRPNRLHSQFSDAAGAAAQFVLDHIGRLPQILQKL